MAKKPLPRRSPGATAAASGATSGAARPKPPARSEAEGRFDKFATFGLALPCTLLAIVGIVIASSYTLHAHDVGFLGLTGKTESSWNTGSESVQRLSGPIQITGFESNNFIGRTAEGEVDVAVLNVGSSNNVNLGDVFTLQNMPSNNVRLEFVVFDVQSNVSRAYVVLGQDVSAGGQRRSLKLSDMDELCGGTTNITVKRDWRDQIQRRWAETRATGS